jgi:hypothetical protein
MTGHVGTKFVNQRSMGLDITIGSTGYWSEAASFKKDANKAFIESGEYNGKSSKINAIREKQKKRRNLAGVDQLVYWWAGHSDQAIVPNQQTMEETWDIAMALHAGGPPSFLKLTFPAFGANHKGMFTFWRVPKCAKGTSDEKNQYNVHYAPAVAKWQKWAAKQKKKGEKYKAGDPEVVAGTAVAGDPKGTPPEGARKPTADELAKGQESFAAWSAKCDHTGILAHGHVQANRLDGLTTVYYMYLRKTGIGPIAAFWMCKKAYQYMNLHKVKYAPVTVAGLTAGIAAGKKKEEAEKAAKAGK